MLYSPSDTLSPISPSEIFVSYNIYDSTYIIELISGRMFLVLVCFRVNYDRANFSASVTLLNGLDLPFLLKGDIY